MNVGFDAFYFAVTDSETTYYFQAGEVTALPNDDDEDA